MSDHLDRDAELRAEVERLRAGLEALAEKWDDPPSPWESPGYYSAYYDCADDIRALLNPQADEQPCCRYCGESGGDCAGPC